MTEVREGQLFKMEELNLCKIEECIEMMEEEWGSL
jgi:hypothetical protein